MPSVPWSTFFARKSSVFWWAPSILALVIKQEQLFHSERAPILNGFGVTIYCPPALLEPCGWRPPCWLGHRDVHHHLPEPCLLHRLAHRPADKNRFQTGQDLCSQESKLQFIANRVTLRKSALVAWVGNPSFTASQPLSESVTLR